MSLKKNLKTAQAPLEIPKKISPKHKFLTGQATLEYFIIFAVLGALTLLSISSFFSLAKKEGYNLLYTATNRMGN